MALKLLFPWEKTEPGQGFFVPCLDFTHIQEMGVRAAIPYRIRVTGVPGIRDGLTGVWFSRLS